MRSPRRHIGFCFVAPFLRRSPSMRATTKERAARVRPGALLGRRLAELLEDLQRSQRAAQVGSE
ncbi:MAG: hypothetical protein KatS3mg077_2737 [Candidatus Binatia bacterium]|nr:MAG: hypothetical protein KatS3mg077_2737 [Candidatus Binatia bacterium]